MATNKYKKPAVSKAEPAKEANDAKGNGISTKTEDTTKETQVNPEILGKKESWFEAPDGKKFKGPADQTSIKVKGYKAEINKMRLGGGSLRHKAIHNDQKTNGKIK